MNVILLNGGTPDHVGLIPHWLDEDDKRPAREQLNEHYMHGGGWQTFDGFKLKRDHTLEFDGDEPLQPLALMWLRDEMIAMYRYGWVMILQPDGSFEVSRMD